MKQKKKVSINEEDKDIIVACKPSFIIESVDDFIVMNSEGSRRDVDATYLVLSNGKNRYKILWDLDLNKNESKINLSETEEYIFVLSPYQSGSKIYHFIKSIFKNEEQIYKRK